MFPALRLAAVFAGLLLCSAHAQERPLLDATQAAADKAGLVTRSFSLVESEQDPHPGDILTYVARVQENDDVREWLVSIISKAPSAEELKKFHIPEWNLYLSTGSKITFPASDPVDMSIHVLGPFSAKKGSKKAKDIWSGAVVSPLFLTVGLNGLGSMMYRVSQEKINGGISVSGVPYSEKEQAAARVFAEAIHLTAQEERALAATLPALMNFFAIASQTPSVKDILFEMVDVPWLKIVANGGQLKNYHFLFQEPYLKLDPAAWHLPPDAPVYAFGLQLLLEGKPALNCQMTVTRPMRPLSNGAGIIGVEARRVDGKGPRFTLTSLAAQPAAPVKTPAPDVAK